MDDIMVESFAGVFKEGRTVDVQRRIIERILGLPRRTGGLSRDQVNRLRRVIEIR